MSNDEILREFLLETHENLTLLDSDLVALEKNPTEKNTLAQVFRTLHSVKGTAGFMGLEKLQAVAHAAESLLNRLRAGELVFNPPIATALLQVVDAIREIMAAIEADGQEGQADYTALLAELDRLREVREVEPNSLPAINAQLVETVAVSIVSEPIAPSSVGQSPPSIATPPVEIPMPLSSPVEAIDARAPSVADANIRVDVTLLDKLMTLVGELVLARNQILQYSTAHEHAGFLGAVQRLNLLTTELQANVMKTRMQPIGNVLNKFPRVVRDLALACQKSVAFEMKGQETELDKTLIEAIRDPLTHMVRNSIDHGIEIPEVRRASGKSAQGLLRMVAFHEGGKVIIEIIDDGAGIDIARVREKAISNKLVTAEVAGRMSNLDIMRMIFQPGFSTAEQVTQFSGRGVGMDVVRTNIEKIGGTVEIESTPGQGTTIRTKIPLTLAIIPALIIVCGNERYAIPQVSLLELLRLDAEQAAVSIEYFHGAPVYRLRGALLPLVFLAEQLQLAAERDSLSDFNIIVLQADERPFGLVVDAVGDTEEIVVKPLQKQLKSTGVFAGAAIMGDGRVALVLDVLGLAQRSGVISTVKKISIGEAKSNVQPIEDTTEPLLLFSLRSGGQMAIPLAEVARLEEISTATIENLGSRQVVKYRNEILPLVDLSRQLDDGVHSPAMDSDTVSVVVYSDRDQSVGLIVGQILDIVHEPIVSRTHTNRRGVLFTAIVQDTITEFVDVAGLIRAVIGPGPAPAEEVRS